MRVEVLTYGTGLKISFTYANTRTATSHVTQFTRRIRLSVTRSNARIRYCFTHGNKAKIHLTKENSMTTPIHEDVIQTIHEEELDLEDIFASMYSIIKDGLYHEIAPTNTNANLDLQYLLAYIIEGRKMVASKE